QTRRSDFSPLADSEADQRRTRWLEGEGFRVRRFWNNEVLKNTNGVLENHFVRAHGSLSRLAAASRRRSTLSHKGRGERKLMSIANSIRAQIPPVHPEGYPFIGGFALASLILFWIWSPLGWIGTVLTVWCALFFRDPVRVTPVREGIVVSPADGRVSMITNSIPPAKLGLGDRPLPRVSIFMSVF